MVTNYCIRNTYCVKGNCKFSMMQYITISMTLSVSLKTLKLSTRGKKVFLCATWNLGALGGRVFHNETPNRNRY